MVTNETREKIIDCDYQGMNRESNAMANDVSTGTVSAVLKDYERGIKKGNRDDYRRLAKFISKNNLSLEDIHDKTKEYSFLRKEKETSDQYEKKHLILSRLKKSDEPLELLDMADNMLDLQEKTGESYPQIEEKYRKMAQSIPILEEQISETTDSRNQLDEQYEARLERNNLSEKQIQDFLNTDSELAQYGLSLKSPLAQEVPKIFQQIQDSGTNPNILIRKLEEANSLEEYNKIKTRENSALLTEIKNNENKLNDLHVQCDATESKHASLEHDINWANKIKETGFSPRDLAGVARTIKTNNSNIPEFETALKNLNDVNSLLSSLQNKKDSLENNVGSLEGVVAQLENKILELTKIKDRLENDIYKKFTNIIDHIQYLKTTNLMRKISTSDNISSSEIISYIALLRKLKSRLSSYLPNSYSIISYIDNSIKELEKGLTHVA